MNLPTWYDAGTVSVANGSASVTGTNTLWGDDAIMAGDLFCDLAQPLVPPQRIASVEDDGSLTLAAPWPGTALSDAAYEIRYVGIIERSTAQTRRLLEQMSVVQANGRGLFYRFSDSVTDADPGSGALGLNNATIGSATAAYADNLDANGASVAADLDTWDDSSSLIKGKLWLRSIASPSSFHAFSVTGSVVDGAGYRKLTLAYVGGSGAFADGEELMVFFVPKGDQGDSFEYDEAVADLAGLAAYDDEAAGFVVLVLDDGEDPSRSAFFTMGDGGSADWALTAYLTGPVGPAPNLTIGTVTTVAAGAPAVAAITGTNPNFVLNLDIPEGERGVNWQDDYSGATTYALDDGVLYNGSSWRALQATTGNAPPTLPTTSNAYWQLLARQGIDGAGTVNSVVAGDGIAVDNSDPTAPVISVTNAEPVGYGDLLVTVSLIALQLADNTNVALFLGDAGNRVADSFDALTYVDVGGAVNLDTSVPGLLKPTQTAAPDQTATHTSATQSGNTVSASNATTGRAAWEAFDKVTGGTSGSGNWITVNGSKTGWLQYQFASAKTIAGYSVRSGNGFASRAPSAWTLEGSNTGAFSGEQVVLDTRSGQTSWGSSGTQLFFAISSPASFIYYRLNVTANNGDANYLQIDEMTLNDRDVIHNLTVRSAAFTAAVAPAKMKALLQVKEVDAATAGTDYTLECSRDDGATWTAMTLTERYSQPSGLRVVEAAETDVSGQPSGTAPRWRFKTLNNKNVELHDVYFYWR